MNRLGKLCEIEASIAACRVECAKQDVPFHADAVAAALGISYDTLLRYANGRGELARLLGATLQECTAAVIGAALSADPKTHGFWMFYLRNRAGFSDKGDTRTVLAEPVKFVGEERIT